MEWGGSFLKNNKGFYCKNHKSEPLKIINIKKTGRIITYVWSCNICRFEKITKEYEFKGDR